MPNNGFNGTTATFNSANLGDGITGVNYTETCDQVDVSVSTDTDKVYVDGMGDKEVQIDFVGTTTIGKGDTGTVSISWNDGTTTTLTNSVCTNVSVKGQLNGAITGSATFKPTSSGS